MQEQEQYSGFSHEYLIKTIQQSHIRLQDEKYKRTVGQQTYARHVSGLRDLRRRAIEALREQDRTQKEFFPIGAYVEYRSIPTGNIDWWSTDSYLSKFATVLAYEDKNVVIQVDSEKFTRSVEPIYLTLRFIRIT